MKRIFTLIAVISVFLCAMAQRPLVTLSHDGNLTFFSNLSALEDALNNAVDGDTIYLSEGKFSAPSGSIRIDKLVSIIGCGYKSHIFADLEMRMPIPKEEVDLTLFDGVRLQKVEFSNSVSTYGPKNINATIAKTWIHDLKNGGCAGGNVFIDRCMIESADFHGADHNYTFIQNSKIKEISDFSYNTAIQVENCNIGAVYYCPRVVISSIIERGERYSVGVNGGMGALGISTVINSWLPDEEIFYAGQKDSFNIINCYFENPAGGMLDDNLEATVDLKEKGYLGEDGKVVGVYGGEFPFSENPSVPTVDSANSSVEYDAENNKLNVTITVSSN